MKTFLEARKMYDGGRAAKTGWNCGDCGAEKNRSDQCRSCGSPARYHRNDPVKNPHLQKEDLKQDFQKAADAGSNLRKFIKSKAKKFQDSDTAKQIRQKKTTAGVKPIKESSGSVDRMADTWNDHADHPHPKVQKHIKKAEAAYNKKDHEGFFHHTQRAADHAHTLSQNKKKFGIKEGAAKNTLDIYQAHADAKKAKKKKFRDIRRSANMPAGYENLKAGNELEGNELTEDYSDHKKNKYELYSDDKTGHPNKKAHDDIHKAVTHPSGELKHVEAAQKKHSKHGAEDTASREQIHKHFTKHHADKEGKTWSYVKENKIVEMVSGFRKGDESVSKKGTLHKSSHIAPDRDGGKVADALNKHERLKTIKQVHKKLLQKEGYFKSLATKNAEKQRLELLKKSKENVKKTTTVAKPNRGMAEENLDELSMELKGRHARAAIKQTGQMQKLKDDPKTPSSVKKAASNTIQKRSKGLDKTWGAQNEDLASGRPAKKPVSSNLLKQRARDNEKALATGFMKLSPKERAKESKRLSEGGVGGLVPLSKAKEAVKGMEKSMGLKKAGKTAKGGTLYKRTKVKESTRDNYNPVVSDKRTKEKLKKAGLPSESPKINEAKKPIVHFKGKDSLKMVKIKYNKPIKTKVTDIGPGGKETVRKDWSEEYGNVAQDYLQELSPKTVSSYQKKAGKQYRDLKKTTPSRQGIENAYHQGYTSDKEYDKQHDDRDKLQKRGKGLAASKGKGIKEDKGRGPTGIAYTLTPGHPDAENPKTREKYPERQTPEYKAKWKKNSKPGLGQNIGLKNPMKEEQQRVVESLSKLMSTGMKNVKKFQDSDTAKQIRQKKTTAGVKPAATEKKR